MIYQNFIPLELHSQHRRIVVLTVLRVLLLALLAIANVSSASAQSDDCAEPQDAPYTLSPGEALSRNMSRDQRHVFRLSLQPQQFARVIVEQKGLDVVVKLLDPNRVLLVERDSPNGKFGPEAVSVVAHGEGAYYIEVCSGRSQPTAAYDLKVEGPRASVPADDQRVAAERAVMEGQRLARQRTAESRSLAIEQFNRAVEISKTIGDAREEGYALSFIGDTFRVSLKFADAITTFDHALLRLAAAQDLSGQAFVFNQKGAAHRDLGNPLNALPEYERALELRSGLGDRWGQAQIHNNVGVIYSRIGEQQKAIASLQWRFPCGVNSTIAGWC